MIKLQDVTKTYSGAVTAVDNLSFTVQEGEIFGLIGTSGCGKTTTLKMINRLEDATSGQISINGQSILERPAEQLRRGIGYVIQDVGLFPHYTVKENIAITPRLLDWQKDRVEQRSSQLLELVGLESDQFAHRMPDALSGGQQQRVGLARALAADPPLILMDEPFGALDPITKERIQKEFKKLLQQIQKTIVLVTHDVFEAFDLCDRVCLMDEGKARQIGPPRELLFQPADNFVESFFANHRFQLQMMSITVGDIIDSQKKLGTIQSPPSPNPNRLEKGKRFADSRIKGDDSFYFVFKKMDSGNKKYTVINDNAEPIAVISGDKLLEGFQQIRQNLKEGRNG